jgi:YggT family protein
MNRILILPFLELVDGLLWFYQLLIFVAVICNVLAAFNVLNTYNRGVFVFISTINRFVEPVLFQIRRFIPSFGGVDFSPVIAIFLVHVLRNVVQSIQMYLLS